MTKLSVNVNKVALLRNSRQGQVPSVLGAARMAIQAGAYGVTVHPRPDERHIRPSDVDDIRNLLKEPDYKHAEFNIEGNPFGKQFMPLVERARPNQCTLVPDSPEQATSDHGWNLAEESQRLRPIIEQLKEWGCRVSLFMNADPSAMEMAKELGANRVELYTEPFALAFAHGGKALEASLNQFRKTAIHAQSLGLGVNGGHDLNLKNLSTFVTIPNILEVSIGHALIADALELGLTNAVKAYLHELASSML